MNPLLGYVAAGALAMGILGGWTVRDWKADADYAAALRKAEAEQAKIQQKADESSQKYEEFRDQLDVERMQTRNTVREIYRNVPVRTECAAPIPAVGLLAQQIADANAAASGEPVVHVSEPPAASGTPTRSR